MNESSRRLRASFLILDRDLGSLHLRFNPCVMVPRTSAAPLRNDSRCVTNGLDLKASLHLLRSDGTNDRVIDRHWMISCILQLRCRGVSLDDYL
jgi:hypothetical protein